MSVGHFVCHWRQEFVAVDVKGSSTFTVIIPAQTPRHQCLRSPSPHGQSGTHRYNLHDTRDATPQQLSAAGAFLKAHPAVAQGRYRGDRMALKRSLVSTSGEQLLLGPRHRQRVGSTSGLSGHHLETRYLSLTDYCCCACLSSDFCGTEGLAGQHRSSAWP